MNCQNCGKRISCGCQRRTASNGKQVCSRCLASYESSIKKTVKKFTPSSDKSPTNIVVTYTPPKV